MDEAAVEAAVVNELRRGSVASAASSDDDFEAQLEAIAASPSPSTRPQRLRIVRDKTKRSLLHMAVENDDRKLVQLLLKHNAYLFSPDIYGETAFHAAAHLGRTQSMRLLLQHFQARDLRDPPEKELKGALEAACRAGPESTACAALLLLANVSPFNVGPCKAPATQYVIDHALHACEHQEHAWGSMEAQLAFQRWIKWERMRCVCKDPVQKLILVSGLSQDLWNLVFDFLPVL